MEVFRGWSGGAGREEDGEENRMKSREMVGRVAAFFDLDGTLILRPSLERRFFAELRQRRAIALGNYSLWLARAAWLAPRGVRMMTYANKMYLLGVSIRDFQQGHQRQGQPARQGSGRAGLAVPRFFPEGVDQVAWHAQRGHAIVLVSGTLAPLAQEMALALVVRLAVRGIAASVAVCATRLEENDGRWTGRIVGDAMFGEAKGRAVQQMAVDKGFELTQCYAYGDSVSDRWMLEAVGRPVAVNPSWRLKTRARRKSWPVLTWAEGKKLKQSSSSTPGEQRNAEQVWENVG
jgi:HAD superfamily hydrolase (TIGR01490 family)